MGFKRIFALFVFSAFAFSSLPSSASEAEKAGRKVGRKAAAKYFGEDVKPSRKVANTESEDDEESDSEPQRRADGDNFLMLHLGSYVDSVAYSWKGAGKRDDVAKATYGITYLYDQWGKLDVNIRGDFSEYSLDDKRATKLSLMPLWTLPGAETRFPLYFGFGVGLGVFFTQVDEESNLSVDYQLVTGARFTDLIEGAGFFIEFGLKNHLHILSDGQLNGTALSAGAIFSF
jgi:hypothetical protein